MVYLQDPGCETTVKLYDVQEEKYDYCIIIDYDHNTSTIEQIETELNNRWYDWHGTKTILLRSNSNKKLLIGFRSGYCYPGGMNKDQLRVIIARKRKKDSKLELMHSRVALIAEERTEFSVRKFKAGNREFEILEYDEDYGYNKNLVPQHDRYSYLRTRVIYLK
ncbi:hypothetical protein ABN763_09045 [Spongiivirga sp. MCCC 1A20706]|uniref:hypothetical protein n=1 Tax=Spongiivirga sp. MCCC 1A20706 TaxID=3160963 RepID=UPI0039779DBF